MIIHHRPPTDTDPGYTLSAQALNGHTLELYVELPGVQHREQRRSLQLTLPPQAFFRLESFIRMNLI